MILFEILVILVLKITILSCNSPFWEYFRNNNSFQIFIYFCPRQYHSTCTPARWVLVYVRNRYVINIAVKWRRKWKLDSSPNVKTNSTHVFTCVYEQISFIFIFLAAIHVSAHLTANEKNLIKPEVHDAYHIESVWLLSGKIAGVKSIA